MIILLILLIGILLLIGAGYQDLQQRKAPFMYFVPTLIGFGLSPFLGAVGLIGSIALYTFWNDDWNLKFGLADALLILTAFICLLDSTTYIFVLATTGLTLFLDLILQKENKDIPLVWLAVKNMLIVFFIYATALTIKRVILIG